MNKIDERVMMVKAMEFIARQVNDEEVFDYWLTYGPGDGEIAYGDIDINNPETEWLKNYYGGGEGWTEEEADEHFRELMDDFLKLMAWAKKDGGLYCGEVTTKAG